MRYCSLGWVPLKSEFTEWERDLLYAQENINGSCLEPCQIQLPNDLNCMILVLVSYIVRSKLVNRFVKLVQGCLVCDVFQLC